MKESEVKALQKVLINWGFLVNPKPMHQRATGIFDEDTRKALIQFQKSRNLPQTGEPGIKNGPTHIALMRAGYNASYDITKIPGIMRKKGWTKGAKFQEKWFTGPVYKYPGTSKIDDAEYAKASPPDTETITMDWALAYQKAKTVYDQMINEKIWVNPPAKEVILRKLIQSSSLVPGKTTKFGDLSSSVLDMNSNNNYVNQKLVNGGVGETDDMTAALGKFVFRVAVKGYINTIQAEDGMFQVVIDEIGVYIRDSFDFTDDGWLSQPLGFWNDEDVSSDLSSWITRTRITNDDYDQWRKKNKRGGDFLVLSKDMRKMNCNDSFRVLFRDGKGTVLLH